MVDVDKIGAVGYSMGGSTYQYISWENPSSFKAGVLLASFLQTDSSDVSFVPSNSTYPPNLLVAVGELDELVNIPSELEKLKNITNTTVESLEEGVTYGSFADGSARRYCLGGSNHIFAAVDHALIDCTIDWFRSSLFQSVFQSQPIFFILRSPPSL